MNDHKAKAESIIAVELAGGSFDQTRDYIALAQVHATLYLAEQQRVANLIALAVVEHGPYKELQGDARDDVFAQIREGLGLS